MKTFVLLTASALALAACSSGPEGPTREAISEIAVNADLSSIGNRNAANYYANLGTDLKTALANQFVDDISPSGARLTVDVDELSLAQSYSQGFSESSSLSGLVTVSGTPDGQDGSYNVTATMAQATAAMSPEAQESATSDEFYRALVEAFAAGVDQTINNPAP